MEKKKEREREREITFLSGQAIYRGRMILRQIVAGR